VVGPWGYIPIIKMKTINVRIKLKEQDQKYKPPVDNFIHREGLKYYYFYV
jgi:hypothetical protein